MSYHKYIQVLKIHNIFTFNLLSTFGTEHFCTFILLQVDLNTFTPVNLLLLYRYFYLSMKIKYFSDYKLQDTQKAKYYVVFISISIILYLFELLQS